MQVGELNREGVYRGRSKAPGRGTSAEREREGFPEIEKRERLLRVLRCQSCT